MPLVPKSKNPFRGNTQQGFVAVRDGDNDTHYLNPHQILNVTHWSEEWGKNTSAIVTHPIDLGGDSTPFTRYKVSMHVDDLHDFVLQARGGAEIDLRLYSGKKAKKYKKPKPALAQKPSIDVLSDAIKIG